MRFMKAIYYFNKCYRYFYPRSAFQVVDSQCHSSSAHSGQLGRDFSPERCLPSRSGSSGLSLSSRFFLLRQDLPFPGAPLRSQGLAVGTSVFWVLAFPFRWALRCEFRDLLLSPLHTSRVLLSTYFLPGRSLRYSSSVSAPSRLPHPSLQFVVRSCSLGSGFSPVSPVLSTWFPTAGSS